MTAAEAKFLLDPYLDWTRRESIPIHEGLAVDLLTAETALWPRLGCEAAFIHLSGRGDWITIFLLALPPSGTSTPQRHLFDEVFYVLSGAGQITVELADGRQKAFDLRPRGLFAPPLNARYRIVNVSQQEPMRLACANNLRILMNIFHDETFFFDNPFAFPERQRDCGNGPIDRNPQKTGFVPDLGTAAMMPATGSARSQLLLNESSLGSQLCEIAANTDEGALCSDAGLHGLCIQGTGHTLLESGGKSPFERIDWKPGLCFALPEHAIHRHVNTGPRPARHVAIGLGTERHPIVHARRRTSERRPPTQIQ